ncbi:hypothetical protein [Granulibacter bethesdensis]|uniref:hypothetical protein n=1 Tax=Granulibacter bethesdensis TaxID=364410 RepID=UPI00046D352B|nr:hypothetical protein [Granulibacter bethesdensis]
MTRKPRTVKAPATRATKATTRTPRVTARKVTSAVKPRRTRAASVVEETQDELLTPVRRAPRRSRSAEAPATQGKDTPAVKPRRGRKPSRPAEDSKKDSDLLDVLETSDPETLN